MMAGIDILFRHQLWGDALHAMISQSDHFFVKNALPLNKNTISAFSEATLIVIEMFHLDHEALEITCQLKKSGHRVIMVGFLSSNSLLSEILDAGLDGYVLKTSSSQNLFMALQEVNNGGKYFCSKITEALNHQVHNNNGNHRKELSNREKSILYSLIELKTPGQIAQNFHISEATVRTHRKNIMRKVGAKNLLSLLRFITNMRT